MAFWPGAGGAFVASFAPAGRATLRLVLAYAMTTTI